MNSQLRRIVKLREMTKKFQQSCRTVTELSMMICAQTNHSIIIIWLSSMIKLATMSRRARDLITCIIIRRSHRQSRTRTRIRNSGILVQTASKHHLGILILSSAISANQTRQQLNLSTPRSDCRDPSKDREGTVSRA